MKGRGATNHKLARWILAALLAAALVGGVLLGQALQLFAYAWPLCLPCIGIQ